MPLTISLWGHFLSKHHSDLIINDSYRLDLVSSLFSGYQSHLISLKYADVQVPTPRVIGKFVGMRPKSWLIVM